MSQLQAYLLIVMLWGLLWGLRRAAGRMAPRAALAPLGFLISRTPVLVVWGLGAAAMFALIWSGARARGNDTISDLLLIVGVSAFCGLGAAALVVGPAWMAIRAFQPSPTFPLEPGETIVREIAANHFLNGEARGGKLLVTTRRLGFRPHRFNVQLATWSARLEEIRGCACEGERLLVVDVGKKEWIVAPNPRQLAGELTRLAQEARD